ncbi:MAG: HAD family hydrolase [Rhodanobacteraceae bacterium]
MSGANDRVVLLDIDNTLLDNDRFAEDLGERLARDFGDSGRDRYWTLYEKLREDTGYADYLGALQRYRAECPDIATLAALSNFVLEYPFAELLYPRALEVIEDLGRWTLPAILSDGDIVFQPHKIKRSGLWDAVKGRVMLTLHKEREIAGLRARFPASHYVMVDDKPRLLDAMKQAMGEQLTTVLVRQGHYARDAAEVAVHALPDVTIEHIGDLIGLDPDALAPVT